MKKFKNFFTICYVLVILMILVYIAMGMMLITMLALNYGVLIGILSICMSVICMLTLTKLLTE